MKVQKEFVFGKFSRTGNGVKNGITYEMLKERLKLPLVQRRCNFSANPEQPEAISVGSLPRSAQPIKIAN